MIQGKHWTKIFQLIQMEIKKNMEQYVKSMMINKINNNLFNELEIESILVQKYEKNKGKYIYHNDFKVSHEKKHYRVVTFLWYLNDVDEGGETEFWGKYKIKPQAGKMILFPASWVFPHCGKMPISSDKYIITGWLITK
jgi:hypothetical protein